MRTVPERYLVLGASGQIGNAVVNRLAAEGADVTVLVRNPEGVGFPPGVKVQAAPIFARAVLESALGLASRVIYALGAPNQWAREKGFFAESNIAVLGEFLAAISEHPGCRLAYVSTFEIFSPEGRRIREDRPITEAPLPPSFDTMRRAYALVQEASARRGFRVVTIHPAAVYGGLSTAHGFTEYLLNLAHRRWLRAPAVIDCMFPIIHADSLADGILRAVEAGAPGSSYILSDGMTSLKGMATALKAVHPSAYSPLTMPVWLAKTNAALLEAVSRHITGRHPLISTDHLKFLLQGFVPDPSKAMEELGWKPMSLEAGILRFLARYFPAPKG